MSNKQIVELFETDPEFHKKHQAHHKAKSVKAFKNLYKGGFLGYNQIHHFSNITNLIKEFDSGNFENITSKLKDFLNEIPENKIYSVLPVLRWQYLNGEYQSITITKSTKITRDTSWHLLTKKIILEIKGALSVYELSGLDIDFFMMCRPWLSADDFDIEKSNLTEIFEDQIEKELSVWSDSSGNMDKQSQLSNKPNKLKTYAYKNIYMNKLWWAYLWPKQ